MSGDKATETTPSVCSEPSGLAAIEENKENAANTLSRNSQRVTKEVSFSTSEGGASGASKKSSIKSARKQLDTDTTAAMQETAMAFKTRGKNSEVAPSVKGEEPGGSDENGLQSVSNSEAGSTKVRKVTVSDTPEGTTPVPPSEIGSEKTPFEQDVSATYETIDDALDLGKRIVFSHAKCKLYTSRMTQLKAELEDYLLNADKEQVSEKDSVLDNNSSSQMSFSISASRLSSTSRPYSMASTDQRIADENPEKRRRDSMKELCHWISEGNRLLKMCTLEVTLARLLQRDKYHNQFQQISVWVQKTLYKISPVLHSRLIPFFKEHEMSFADMEDEVADLSALIPQFNENIPWNNSSNKQDYAKHQEFLTETMAIKTDLKDRFYGYKAIDLEDRSNHQLVEEHRKWLSSLLRRLDAWMYNKVLLSDKDESEVTMYLNTLRKDLSIQTNMLTNSKFDVATQIMPSFRHVGEDERMKLLSTRERMDNFLDGHVRGSRFPNITNLGYASEGMKRVVEVTGDELSESTVVTQPTVFKKVAVFGASAYGKSALLQKMCLEAIKHRLDDPRNATPIFLDIRDMVQSLRGDQLKRSSLEEFFHDRKGRCDGKYSKILIKIAEGDGLCVFLDGLDYATKDQQALLQLLQNGLFRHCRQIIISSSSSLKMINNLGPPGQWEVLLLNPLSKASQDFVFEREFSTKSELPAMLGEEKPLDTLGEMMEHPLMLNFVAAEWGNCGGDIESFPSSADISWLALKKTMENLVEEEVKIWGRMHDFLKDLDRLQKVSNLNKKNVEEKIVARERDRNKRYPEMWAMILEAVEEDDIEFFAQTLTSPDGNHSYRVYLKMFEKVRAKNQRDGTKIVDRIIAIADKERVVHPEHLAEVVCRLAYAMQSERTRLVSSQFIRGAATLMDDINGVKCWAFLERHIHKGDFPLMSKIKAGGSNGDGQDVFQFTMLVMQEHYAGWHWVGEIERAVRDEGEEQPLLIRRMLDDKVGDPWYQEMLLAALSYASPPVFEQIARLIMINPHPTVEFKDSTHTPSNYLLLAAMRRRENTRAFKEMVKARDALAAGPRAPGDPPIPTSHPLSTIAQDLFKTRWNFLSEQLLHPLNYLQSDAMYEAAEFDSFEGIDNATVCNFIVTAMTTKTPLVYRNLPMLPPMLRLENYKKIVSGIMRAFESLEKSRRMCAVKSVVSLLENDSLLRSGVVKLLEDKEPDIVSLVEEVISSWEIEDITLVETLAEWTRGNDVPKTLTALQYLTRFNLKNSTGRILGNCLANSHWEVRARACSICKDLNLVTVDTGDKICDLMEDNDQDVRLAALTAMHDCDIIDTPTREQSVLWRLRDRNAKVRDVAVSIVHNNGGISQESLKTILKSWMVHEEGELRRDAVLYVKEFRLFDDEITTAMTTLMFDEEDAVRTSTIHSLDTLRYNSEVTVLALRKLLQHSHATTRSTAVEALDIACQREIDTLQDVVGALHDEDPDVVDAAAKVLKNAFSRGTQLPYAALEWILTTVRTPPGEEIAAPVYTIALGMLVLMDEVILAEEGLIPVLINAIRMAKQPSIRIAGINVVGTLGLRHEEFYCALAIASEDQNVDVRRAVTGALGKIRALDDELLVLLLQRMQDQNLSVRRSAVEASEFLADCTRATLGKENMRQVANTFTSLLASADDVTSARAAAIVRKNEELHDDIAKVIVSRLWSKDLSVRMMGVNACLPCPCRHGEVRRALAAQMETSGDSIRLQITKYYGILEKLHKEEVDLLVNRCRDPSVLVRKEAVRSLQAQMILTAQVLKSLVWVAEHDKDMTVTEMAVMTLANSMRAMKESGGDPLEVLRVLKFMLKVPGNKRYTEAAWREAVIVVKATGMVFRNAVEPILLNWMKHPNATIRMAGIDALQKFQWVGYQLVTDLTRLLGDDDEDIAVEAETCIVSLKILSDDDLFTLVSCFKNKALSRYVMGPVMNHIGTSYVENTTSYVLPNRMLPILLSLSGESLEAACLMREIRLGRFGIQNVPPLPLLLHVQHNWLQGEDHEGPVYKEFRAKYALSSKAIFSIKDLPPARTNWRKLILEKPPTTPYTRYPGSGDQPVDMAIAEDDISESEPGPRRASDKGKGFLPYLSFDGKKKQLSERGPIQRFKNVDVGFPDHKVKKNTAQSHPDLTKHARASLQKLRDREEFHKGSMLENATSPRRTGGWTLANTVRALMPRAPSTPRGPRIPVTSRNAQIRPQTHSGHPRRPLTQVEQAMAETADVPLAPTPPGDWSVNAATLSPRPKTEGNKLKAVTRAMTLFTRDDEAMHSEVSVNEPGEDRPTTVSSMRTLLKIRNKATRYRLEQVRRFGGGAIREDSPPVEYSNLSYKHLGIKTESEEALINAIKKLFTSPEPSREPTEEEEEVKEERSIEDIARGRLTLQKTVNMMKWKPPKRTPHTRPEIPLDSGIISGKNICPVTQVKPKGYDEESTTKKKGKGKRKGRKKKKKGDGSEGKDEGSDEDPPRSTSTATAQVQEEDLEDSTFMLPLADQADPTNLVNSPGRMVRRLSSSSNEGSRSPTPRPHSRASSRGTRPTTPGTIPEKKSVA